MSTVEQPVPGGAGSKLDIQGAAGIYAATWQDLHVRADHVVEDKRAFTARFTFTTKLHPAPVTAQCNMVSGAGKKALASMLADGLGLLDAREYVEALCQGVMAKHTAGEPVIALDTVGEPPPLAYLSRRPSCRAGL